jgi:hypothetical protein
MRGSYANHYLHTTAVEREQQKHKEACEQRLAKAMNTPKEKINTPWPEQKPEGAKK